MGFFLSSSKCLPLQTSYLEWFISLSGDFWGLRPAGEFSRRLQGCGKIAQECMYTCMCINVCLASHIDDSKRKTLFFSHLQRGTDLRINIFTSLPTFGSHFLDASVSEALIAFVLNPGSCTVKSRHPVRLNRFPKRDSSSSQHTGALTPHQWSFGLKYLFFYPTRSKLCWLWAKEMAVENSDAYPSMLGL